MANGTPRPVFRDIDTLFRAGTSNGMTDAQLLDRFRARSDQSSSEAAFAGLMARHGPMVLGVCRRALSNPEDVADAFQATFLILVRKANSVRVDDSLGRWLYGVSRRVSVRAKRTAARRSTQEIPKVELAVNPAADLDLNELRVVLDDEIDRLPAKYRSAVVLCDLDGLGQDEAARQLGCAVGTIKSRLSRAREKLRSRLMRRGIAPSACALRSKSDSPVVPAELIDSTVKAAFVTTKGIISPSVTLLLQGVLQAMFLKKLSMVAIAIVIGLATVTGAGVSATGRTKPTPIDVVRAACGSESRWHERIERCPPADLLERENDEQLTDRITYIGLDVQLLLDETRARLDGINGINGELIDIQLHREKSAKTTLKLSLSNSVSRMRERSICRRIRSSIENRRSSPSLANRKGGEIGKKDSGRLNVKPRRKPVTIEVHTARSPFPSNLRALTHPDYLPAWKSACRELKGNSTRCSEH